MAYLHEMINATSQLPVKVFTFRSSNPKRIIPKHWHLSAELIYCLSGSLVIWDGSEKYVLRANDVVLINPNEIHSTQSPDENHVLVIQFPLEFLQKVTSHKFYEAFEFNINTVRNHQTAADLIAILNQLVSVSQQATIIDNLHATAAIFELLAVMCTNYMVAVPVTQHVDPTDLTLLGNITGYIQQHYQERLTLPAVAKQFGYSSSYFSRFFAHRMNLTFSGYLQQLRLDSASNHLMNSNETLTNIAFEVGFSSYRNFYNAFFANYQMSPTEYRHRYQQDKILHVHS